VDIHEGEVDRLLAGIDDAGRGAGVVFGHVDDPRRKEAQAVEVVGSHLGDNAVVAVKDVVGDLAADDGGDALDGGEQCLGQRGVLAGAQPLLDLLGGGFDEVELILRRRQSVVHAGEDGAHRGHGVVDAFDRVDDPAVLVDEDDVGVTAHDLDGQRQLNQVAHLVAGFKDQVQDAVQPDLSQRNELGAAQVLAQQHTEHGRCFGVFEGGAGQVDAGAVRAGGEVELYGASPVRRGLRQAEDEHHLLPGNLMDLVDPRVEQAAFQFVLNLAQQGSVKCHGNSPF